MSSLKHMVSSTDSSDGDAWASSRKSSKKKRPRLEHRSSDPEEGEIPSDAFDDDEDDGLDDDLYGGEEDKQRLLKMSEKEREEELYRRSERREAMKIRRDVKKRLKEKKEREKAERANRERSGESPKDKLLKPIKKSSAYANVYSSDSDQGSSSEDESTKGGLRDRKLTLAMQKAPRRSKRLQELADRRKEIKSKKETLYSASDDERVESHSQPKHHSRRGVYSSSSSDSDSSRSMIGQSVQKRRSTSSYSRSSSTPSSDSSDDDRGRSRSPEVEYITTLEQLSKIRLSRFKLEKWVHMPFFDNLVKGCFVRIHIGQCRNVPVYRCGEIIDVKEMAKPYDLGKTRTNKGIVIRLGKDQHTFRLMFVSNSEFLPVEFESWKKYSNQAGIKPPTTSFIAQKTAEIHKYLTNPISDERVVEQIIQSKRRFQKVPINFALKKAELLKQRELANESNDTETTRRIDMELDELETQAERIERRRTIGFKAISSINQRNRALSLKQAEEAILKEAKETAESHEVDPFTRIQSKPVIATKSYLERLRNMRNGILDENAGDEKDGTGAKGESESGSQLDANKADKPSKFTAQPPKPPEESLHDIHDFEIDINVELNENSNRPSLEAHDSGVRRPVTTPIVPIHGSTTGSNADQTNSDKPHRRFLNLQEYKRRRGLI
uniref:RNA polymerase associated protein RTF1 n=1 Tax=Echinococcus granulosus TaxID=6210 RepID=A0A068WYS3_ECHGR|nr:RNA polymerase associated protein RTF1 [Echinococcus granulosus]